MRNIYFTSLHFTSLHFTSLCFALLYFTLSYLTLLYFTLPQGEKGGISVLFARYKSSVDKLFNLVYDGAQKREIQNCEPLDLVKQMEDALQEIGRLCKQQEEETAFQKMENTTKALRLAYEDSNNTGYCNLLPLMEELKENMAALEKVANKEGRVPVEENETAF